MKTSKQVLLSLLDGWADMDTIAKAQGAGELIEAIVREAQTEDVSKSLSATEVCRLLNISRPTLYKYIQEGRIPAKRISTRWIFSQDEIDDLMLKLNTAVAIQPDKGPEI